LIILLFFILSCWRALIARAFIFFYPAPCLPVYLPEVYLPEVYLPEVYLPEAGRQAGRLPYK
jgi:hypothetical protein